MPVVERLNLDSRATELGRRLKTTQVALNDKVAAKYGKLSVAEVQLLGVDDKWLVRLAADVQGELERVSQVLTTRIRQLAERYTSSPLPDVPAEVATLARRVDGHLEKMSSKP